MKNERVRKVILGNDLEARVGLVTVSFGEVEIRGVAVWKSRAGKLRVSWPGYWNGEGRSEAIALPHKLRDEIEAEIIAAVQEAQRESENRAERPNRSSSAGTAV